MIRDISPLAVERTDPWEKIQIDSATRRLAERAAAAAGLAVEEWLERAIHRACPSAFRSASVTIPATPVVAPTVAAAPTETRRALTIAERLAQQRFADAAEEATAPSRLHDEGADHDRNAQDKDDRADAPRLLAAHDAEESDAEHGRKKKFKLWASRDEQDFDERQGEPRHAAQAQPLPPSHTSRKRFAFLAVAIALAITAGAVTAQYLTPGDSRAPVAPRNNFAASTPNFSLPTPADNTAPSFNNSSSASGDASSAARPGIPSLPPSPPASTTPGLPPPLPGLSSSNSSNDFTPPASLPPIPGLPSHASMPNDNAAPSVPPRPVPGSEANATPTPPVAKPEKPEAVPAASVQPATVPKGKATAPATTSEAAPPVPAKAEPAPTKTASATIRPRPSKPDDVAPSDPKALAPWLEQRAKSGDAIAQYRLGVLYALGQGVAQDYPHAAQLFKTSAEGGVAEAQYNIAVMFGDGLGIGRDPVQAVQWYQKAAAQGNANAAFNLGVAYSNGVGVSQSMTQAAQWFRRAAAAGIVNAQFNLGLLYERGDGVPVSQVEAYAWYSAAATHGDSGAAQRRDRLASTLALATLKEAQARAVQVAATIKNSGPHSGGGLATGNATKASALKP
jgi:TPR repeat protein